jgi:hypothetical protein
MSGMLFHPHIAKFDHYCSKVASKRPAHAQRNRGLLGSASRREGDQLSTFNDIFVYFHLKM